MSYANGPRIVTSGLVLYMDAGNSKSYPGTGTAWNDLSGNGNNGTLTNGPTYSSDNKGSIVLDGSNDYITCGNNSSLNITGNITISFWIKLLVTNKNQTVVHKDNQYTLNFGYQGPLPGANLSYADSSHWSYINFGYHGSFLANNWYNIIAIRSSNNVTIYANNILIISKTFGSAITVPATTYNCVVGGYANASSAPTENYTNANISMVSIYNRALSSSEVSQNFNATKGRFGL